jgi:hypothetical protein
VTPIKDRKSGELYTAFVVTVTAITAGMLLTAGLLRLVDRLEPQTGDIIAFSGYAGRWRKAEESSATPETLVEHIF